MKTVKIIALTIVMSIMLSLSAFASYKGYVFVYRYNGLYGEGTTPLEEPVLSYLWNMGYNAGGYLNNSAGAVYNSLPNAQILVTCNHGNEGYICAGTSSNDSRLVGRAYSGMPSNYRAVSNYSANQLSGVDIAMYVGCKTGVTHATYGNLVDNTLSKGARAAVGWTETINIFDAMEWTEMFFLYYSNENTMNISMLYAGYAMDDPYDYDAICSRYVGSSDVYVFHIPE